MSTLATINGEALAVPGLRFWGARDLQGGWPDRVSLICSDHQGAIELWSANGGSYGDIGGVEVHSRTPQYDGHEPMSSCAALHGADCYTDGSSLAYSEKFAPLIAVGDSRAVLEMLADWHRSRFGETAAS